jgi:PilZ domain
MPSTANSERRRNSRKRPPSLIYVELSSTNGGMMRDLSEEGFALRAMMPLRVGDEVYFSFLLDPISRVEGQGAVLWVEENGRVAGIRFTELAAQSQEQIRSWLAEELESQEAEKKAPAEPDAQTFEMLREELRASAPRPDSPKTKAQPAAKPTKSKWPVVRPETAPSEAPSFAARKFSEDAPDVTARPVEPEPFPGLPSFSSTQEAIEISFDPLPESPPSARDPFPAEPSARRTPVTAFPNRSESPAPKGPMLPDISEILMHPPRRDAGYGPKPPVLEPLDAPHPRRPVRTGGFTLARALTIMALLALIVGGFVYHDFIGEGLVWLGQQIGGSNGAPAITPAAKDEPPAAEASPSPSTSSSNAPATPSSSAPAAATPDTSQTKEPNNAAATPATKPPVSLPSLEKKPQPPVTPLSGIASGGASESASEAGQSEYSQAMQLLHNGIATDTSEAVRLLWISVEKGNPNAELTLAELYWRGQGVARNCDQTGILLGAAARKGNAEAQKRLKQFRQEGCE